MGMASKVAMGVALTIVVTVLTTFAAVRAVDQDSEKLMYSLGAKRWQVFTKLVVPSVLPWIIASLRVNIGLALAGAIVGEFIASEHGLGRAILYAGQTYGVAWIERVLLKQFMHGANVQ
jgi:NitT/TauT family transport system permease protein